VRARVVTALALVGALAVPGGAVAKRDGERPATKPRQSCPKAGKARAKRCARVRRLSARRAAVERLVGVPPPTAGVPGSGSGGEPGAGAPPPLPRSVSVTAHDTADWYFVLSQDRVAAGSVRIELRNAGEDPHNLVVSPDDGSHSPLATWTDIEPGSYLRKFVTLDAGRYQLWCSLLDHEARGMTADLVVE
jgi:plastocyanin